MTKCKALRKGLNELAVEGATCPAERRKEGKAKEAPTFDFTIDWRLWFLAKLDDLETPFSLGRVWVEAEKT